MKYPSIHFRAFIFEFSALESILRALSLLDHECFTLSYAHVTNIFRMDPERKRKQAEAYRLQVAGKLKLLPLPKITKRENAVGTERTYQTR